ncbi:MAG: hypothetical protein Q9217_002675 [Psora testacea]
MPSKQVDGAVKRHLPKKHNPELATDKTPQHSELVKKRRLGQTNLSVRPGQVGLNNATKPENLGPFDYAHLRAPLPKELKGSEIFAPQQHQPPPESYFLMRRSNDGFVSATGMFKAAFPWAKHAEEQSEKEYIKALSSTATDEIAGNVWISEHFGKRAIILSLESFIVTSPALELADDYGIAPWIRALLDPAPIAHTSEDPNAKSISPPPKFKFTAGDKAHLPPPNGTPARGARASTPKSRGRPRAGSPEKKGSPQKSAKKPRATKATKEANAATAREASASLQASLDSAASVADSESVNGEKVKVGVQSTVEKKGDIETTITNVKIEMPKDAAELPLPESPEQMIEKAKAMVEEARRMDGKAGPSTSKRKAEELDDDSDDSGDFELQPVKKARLLQEQIKKEKVRNRALIGVAATLVIGSV